MLQSFIKIDRFVLIFQQGKSLDAQNYRQVIVFNETFRYINVTKS